MLNRYPVRNKKVADQPPMALLEKPFRTQDRRPFLSGNLQQFLHPFSEVAGEHVVGVVPKSFVLKAHVWGFIPLFVPTTSQGF